MKRPVELSKHYISLQISTSYLGFISSRIYAESLSVFFPTFRTNLLLLYTREKR